MWQPRVGIAWDPTGTGSWSVRAGFSIVNDLMDNNGHRAYAMPPFNARETLTAAPANGILPLIPLVKSQPLAPGCAPGAVFVGCNIFQPGSLDPNMFTPTIQEWSFTVQRKLTRDLMLEVGYAGSQSYHTNVTEDTNSPAPQVCQVAQGCRSGGVLAANQAAIVPQGTLYFPSTPPVVVNGVSLTQRPNPYVANTTAWYGEGVSNYHALNVSLVKRVTHGLMFRANYTYAKVIDLNSAILAPSGENEPADVFSPYNLALNRGTGLVQPPPPVQCELQLSIAVRQWTAFRRRSQREKEPIDRRLAMERHHYGSGWFPADAFDRFQQFRHRRHQRNGRTQLESEFSRKSGFGNGKSMV